MSSDNSETRNLAIFADFENVALGAQQSKYPKFEIEKVLERLLVKGNVVVRKAYCDWTRYQKYKRGMHESNFELIDIPHLSQSGKNSADIRMVVDALDLCYTKNHLNTFVIISGDSDFSPLVSKLRENDKIVIGVGVKNSTSELFVSICDEFIFYDDLVIRKEKRKPNPKKNPRQSPTSGNAVEVEKEENSEKSARREKAIDLIVQTVESMIEERGDESKIWGSMIKQAIKRINPGFNERYHGFKSFSSVLEEAEKRGLLELEVDEKSGGHIVTLTDE
ncbi:MAG: NYN domain-containing protein [Verrucomicrobiales bacterium]|nr:NYN domain-containing protein [Verrucomicrobiales bacterium]